MNPPHTPTGTTSRYQGMKPEALTASAESSASSAPTSSAASARSARVSPGSTGRMNLTPKQLRILQIIRDCRTRHGYSPTLQEIADDIGVSKVTVFEHVEALIRKGALVRDPNKARSLSLSETMHIPDEQRPTRFPLVGRIAAGYPIEKVENRDELDLEAMFGPRRGQVGSTFALQVEGDSMHDEGIWDGDYVLVERRNTAHNGERVVALLESGETTLKTFYKEKGHIRLQPANPDFKPIIVSDCQIQGVVMGVLRRYT